MNGLKTTHTAKALDASTFYLQALDNAIVEAESTLSALRITRGAVSREMLGEGGKDGSMTSVLNGAGPAIRPPIDPTGGAR